MRHRRFCGLYIGAAFHFGDQAGAFNFSLALRAFEGMPFAAPLSVRVLQVKDDCEMSRRPLSDMPSHRFALSR
jgi:hypothetical protein